MHAVQVDKAFIMYEAFTAIVDRTEDGHFTAELLCNVLPPATEIHTITSRMPNNHYSSCVAKINTWLEYIAITLTTIVGGSSLAAQLHHTRPRTVA